MRLILFILSALALSSTGAFAAVNCDEGALVTYDPGDYATFPEGQPLPALDPGLTWEYSHTEEGGGAQTYRVVGRRTAQPGVRIFKIGDTLTVRDDSFLPQLPSGLTWEYSHIEEGGGAQTYRVVARR